MQSPIATTFSFNEDFTLSKPNRRIDQIHNLKYFYKKVFVVAEPGCDLTEYAALLKQLGLKVYDDIEALRNGDHPIWLEATEAKKAGKPYGTADWNKLLGAYDTVITHLAMPFAEKFMDPADHPLVKVIVVTQSPDVTTGDNFRSFLVNRVFSLVDPCAFGSLAQIKNIVGNGLLDYHMIRSSVTGPQQKLMEVGSFDKQIVCNFINEATPKGPMPAVESVFTAHLRYVQDFIGYNYIHDWNMFLIAISVMMAFVVVGYVFTSWTLFVLLGLALVIFFLVSVTPEESVAAALTIGSKPVVPPSALVPPHLRKKSAAVADNKSIVVAPAIETKPTIPASALVPPHRRKKHVAVFDHKPTQIANSTASAIEKQSPPARSRRSKPRATNKAKPTQATQSNTRSGRPLLSAWTNVEESIRKDDLKVRRENQAKAEATKDMEPGVWTEKYGLRSSKVVVDKKDGDA